VIPPRRRCAGALLLLCALGLVAPAPPAESGPLRRLVRLVVRPLVRAVELRRRIDEAGAFVDDVRRRLAAVPSSDRESWPEVRARSSSTAPPPERPRGD